MALVRLEMFGLNEIVLIAVVLLFNLLFWGGLVYLIVYFVKRQPNTGRKCPFCAEMIQPEAIVCRFCGRDLPKRG